MREEMDGNGGGRAAACRSCGARGLDVFLSLGSQPLANALRSADELDLPEPRYPLEVAFCAGCSLAQLTVSVPPEQLFAEYSYFSSFSPSVVANAAALVARLVEERQLGSGHLALEIASNDGYLLKHYVAEGVQVLGVEPAANVAVAAEAAGVPTHVAFFGRQVAEELRAAGRWADVLHANNVMAHVPDPNGVVAGIERVLAEGGLAVFESPYVRELVDKLEFDTIYHEHLFYYSLSSFSALLERNGLEVVDVERIPIHGGTLRVFAMRRGEGVPSPAVGRLAAEEHQIGLDRRAWFEGFGERVEGLCASMRSLLADLKGQGRRIAGYGAAAKATVMLNALGVGAETIDYVADRSPHKQGRYLPGTRIPIVPAERLVEDQADDVVIFAWNFADEIMAEQAVYRAAGGRFVIPVPEPTVV